MHRPVCIFLSVALLSAAAAADTLRVPQDYETIAEAISEASGGDTVLVAKGTYPPFTVVKKAGLTIKGKGKPVIVGLDEGSGANISVAFSNDIVIDGFVAEGGFRGVLIASSSGVTVRRCTVRDTTSDGIRAWGSTGLLLEKNRIEDVGADGIDFSPEPVESASEGLAGPAEDSIIRKSRITGGETGIDLEGPGHTVEKNRIERTGDRGLETSELTIDAVISKNRLVDTNGTAMHLEGSGLVVEKNRVLGSMDEGFTVLCTNARIEKNRLVRVAADAIDLESDDNQILGNRISKTGDNGLEVSPANGDPFPVKGNLIEGNRILKSGGDGIFTDVGGNTYRRNKAKKSGDFDLEDQAGEGANVYEDNTFGTVLID